MREEHLYICLGCQDFKNVTATLCSNWTRGFSWNHKSTVLSGQQDVLKYPVIQLLCFPLKMPMSDHCQLDNVAITKRISGFLILRSSPHPRNSQAGSNAQFPFYVRTTKDPIKCCKISFIYHRICFFFFKWGLSHDTHCFNSHISA